MVSRLKSFNEKLVSIHSDVERFCRAKGERGPHLIPRKRQTSNEFHRIFSIKAGMRIVTCESPLEADAVLWAESRKDVVTICEQPLRICGSIGKKPYYTFDLALKFLNGREVFYEVKPLSSLAHGEDGRLLPPDWVLIESWCALNGETCDIITDETLANHAQLIKNWRVLLPYAVRAYKEPDPALERSLISMITQVSVCDITRLCARESNVHSEHVIAHIAKLLHQGVLKSDLSKSPVSPSTMVEVKNHA